MTYTYEVPISFHLTDEAGILFYSHVFTLAHQAYESFITKKLGFSWQEWFHHQEWIIPIKHAEATYHAPLHVGKPCFIELHVTDISNSSFGLQANFNQPHDECCAIVKTVHVFCERALFRKCPIPQHVRELLINCKTSFLSTFDKAERGI